VSQKGTIKIIWLWLVTIAIKNSVNKDGRTPLNKTNMEKKYTYKGKEYRIVHFVKMRVKGDWVDGVLYEAMYLNPDGRYFVRTKEEFDLLFSLKK
jgi:hypothetical protein